MPTIQGTAALLTATVNDNVITGSQWEYLPYNAAVEFGLVGSATGLVCDVFSGQDNLAEGFAPSTANRFPVYPDDFTLTDVAAAGERLKIRVRNPTGGTLTIFFCVRISPVG